MDTAIPRPRNTTAKTGPTDSRQSEPEPESAIPTRETPNRSKQDRALEEQISDTYRAFGAVATLIAIPRNDDGLAGVGNALVDNADKFGAQWMNYADRNPKVKAALKKFTEASAVGELVMTHAIVLMPLLVDRGILPGVGITPPGANAAAASGAGGQPFESAFHSNGDGTV